MAQHRRHTHEQNHALIMHKVLESGIQNTSKIVETQNKKYTFELLQCPFNLSLSSLVLPIKNSYTQFVFCHTDSNLQKYNTLWQSLAHLPQMSIYEDCLQAVCHSDDLYHTFQETYQKCTKLNTLPGQHGLDQRTPRHACHDRTLLTMHKIIHTARSAWS